MKSKTIKILAIETSCDETSASIVEGLKLTQSQPKADPPLFESLSSTPRLRLEKRAPQTLERLAGTIQPTILSNVISSQIDLHAKFGGVVPEVAARAHMENIIPAIKAALNEGRVTLDGIDVISVTVGPGLIGSLLVGVNTAKTLSYALRKPIIGVNHLEGHIYANFIREVPNSKFQIPNSDIKFPLITLIVSGGHTSLVLMKKHLKYQIIGETLDDAAGEAFDKVGKLLNLPYPGGPNVEKAAKKGNARAFNFPRALMEKDNFNFSFSGLKTAVLREVLKISQQRAISDKLSADLAASFQQAVIDVLVEKTLAAARKYKIKTIMLAGGVAANEELKKQFNDKLQAISPRPGFLVPPKILCTDNAAMIATAGYFRALKKDFTKWQKLNADPNLKLKNG